jgi:hypothetical protein
LWLSIGNPFGNDQVEQIAQPDHSLASLTHECEFFEGIGKNIGSYFEWIYGVEPALVLTDEHDVEANMLKCKMFDGCKIELARSE